MRSRALQAMNGRRLRAQHGVAFSRVADRVITQDLRAALLACRAPPEVCAISFGLVFLNL